MQPKLSKPRQPLACTSCNLYPRCNPSFPSPYSLSPVQAATSMDQEYWSSGHDECQRPPSRERSNHRLRIPFRVREAGYSTSGKSLDLCTIGPLHCHALLIRTALRGRSCFHICATLSKLRASNVKGGLLVVQWGHAFEAGQEH